MIIALLSGWLAGLLANRAADILPAGRWRHFWADFTLQALPHDCTLWWYPWLAGRCPHCGQQRSWRAPVLEVAMIASFYYTWRLWSQSPTLVAIGWFDTLFLLTVLVIDYEQHRVLNKILLPMSIGVGLLHLMAPTPYPWSMIIGGFVGFGFFLLLALLFGSRIGAGDVKLAGVIGLMTGYPHVLTALLIGIVFGGIAAVGLLLSRRANRQSTMAYAPYLVLGTLVTLWFQVGIGW